MIIHPSWTEATDLKRELSSWPGFDGECAANFVATPDGEIIAYGETFLRLFRLRQQEIQPNLGLYRFLPELRSVLVDHINLLGWRTVGHTDDDRKVDVVVSTSATLDDGGHPVRILGSVVKLHQRSPSLQESQRWLTCRALTAGLAHDLNNVLAPILMYLPLLHTKLSSSDDRLLIETLTKPVRRCADLVQNLISIIRSDEDTAINFDVDNLVREVVRKARLEFPQSLDVLSDYPENLPRVRGEPAMIFTLLWDLCCYSREAISEEGTIILNAQEHTPLHPMTGEQATGRWVRLSLSDTGSAPLPDAQGRLLDTGPRSGLATVLAEADSRLRRFGGSLGFESRDDAGFTVHIHLQATAQPTVHGEETTVPVCGEGQLVLVIDDEKGIREVSRRFLVLAGYTVVTAPNGDKALELFGNLEGKVEAVVCDLSMSGMSGTATIKAFHELEPELAIIAMTGAIDERENLENAAVEVFATLDKPFKARELVCTLAEVFRRGRRA